MYSHLPVTLTCLLFIHISIKVHCMELNTFENQRIRKSLSMCVIQACKQYFTSNFETVTFSLPLTKLAKNVVSVTKLNELLLPVLEDEQRWTLLVKDLNVSQEIKKVNIRKSFSYIIQIRKEGEFGDNIKKLKRFLSWNPHAKFLVVSTTVFARPREVAIDVIKSLWSHNVINAAVLLADDENTTTFNLYSWSPYSPHSCGNNFNDTNTVDTCSFGVTQSGVTWFGNKIPKHLYKCPIKVKYLVWPPFVMGLKPIVQVRRN